MSTTALLLDYLFARPLIEARLVDQVADLAGGVYGIDELAQAVEKNITAPTAFVLWEGDAFGDSAVEGRSQIMRQQWTVLLAVRNATQQRGAPRNESAGPLMSAVHKALAGWKPEGALRPLARTTGRRANYTRNVGLYPLAFQLPLNI